MLRQIARLGRAVPSAGERALAVAVYADAGDEAVPAREAGYEGVACVDDAARALELYCDLWQATRSPWALRWCEGLLDFVLAMQDTEGRWVNFILDWEGTPNRTGRTSVAGGGFWQARAVLALARATRVLSDERIDAALQRGLRHIVVAGDVPADVRALHILTALTLLHGAEDQGLHGLLSAWSDEVVGCRDGDMLMNSPFERGQPHLWAHIQEGVLADAGARLGRDDLVAVACRSAALVFAPIVRTGFDLPRTQPYDVASTVYALSRLAEVTGVSEYSALAAAARGWFDGRNPSGRPVYSRGDGRVGDGVDSRRVSMQSGAEANIVAAQALFADVLTLAARLNDSEALPASLTTP
ncbi:MAG TPA: hypothetical protein VI316_08045 [Candidatus Dormibacteraeota bacterium]